MSATHPVEPPTPHPPTLAALWFAALVVAAIGTWLLFRAQPGLNWGIVTLSAALALVGGGRRWAVPDPAGARFARHATLLGTLALGLALATGAALTADGAAHVLIAVTACGLFAVAIDGSPGRSGVATFPFRVAGRVGLEVLRRLDETFFLASSARWRPLIRGTAVAIPVVLLFGVMLAAADPVLATARDQLVHLLTSWDALPRALFFGSLFVATAGACGRMARGHVSTGGARPLPDRAGIGAVERAIVLAAVTLLFAGFLVLQVSYLFGNLPSTTGSGVTFAEYARRGFAELTVVTTLCIVLIALLDHGVSRGSSRWPVRLLELVLLAELGLLLASAFRRLVLYETAYGFTIARVYGQASMVWLTVVLGVVGLELRRRFDGHRVVRRALVAAILLIVTMIYWNHEAWIVRRNVARVASTRQFDVRYAVWWLSPNAVPALVGALAELPPDVAASVRVELFGRYGTPGQDQRRWYEWNLRWAQARSALRELHGGRAPLVGGGVGSTFPTR